MNDYMPGDEYDWDQSNDSQYCEHGTFIGSHWGPDLMCGWCEDGVSLSEYRQAMERQAAQRRRKLDDKDTLDWAINAHLTFRLIDQDKATAGLLAVLEDIKPF